MLVREEMFLTVFVTPFALGAVTEFQTVIIQLGPSADRAPVMRTVRVDLCKSRIPAARGT